ncbi:MAG: hypothetical protein DRP71_16605 [Verrucomicrobia bacterium]|nr:MAG: hypothetical protein DRP71_16605 [Verrucomicrobiota bacterium]
MHVSMRKIQILFPEPQMKRLRELAKVEDRPVSEIVRRAVDRDLEQRAASLGLSPGRPPAFPTFDGGKIQTDAGRMKELIYGHSE